MHRAEVIRIEGESYHAKEAQQRLAVRARLRSGQGRRQRQGQAVRPRNPPASLLPAHWSPEQALAVFECLHALREQLWMMYGTALQQAWRDQLLPECELPDFDPDAAF